MIKFLQKKQRASALLISIIAMSAMFVVVFGSAYMVLINTSKEISLGDQLRARYLALAGAERLRYEVNKNSYDLNISCPTAQLLFSHEINPDFFYEVYCEEVEGENTFYSKAVYKNSFSIVPVVFNDSFVCGDILTDTRDDNTYNTVQIGTQCWMAENLRYLPVVHSNTEFETQGVNTLPGYGVHGYNGSDIATAKAEANYLTHGVLYNGHAVSQVSICPDGWHAPSDTEWHTLENYLATGVCDSLRSGFGCDPAATKMKVVSFLGDNSSGFTALPSGYRYIDGVFWDLGYVAFFGSSDISESRSLFADFSEIDRSSGIDPSEGHSIRCIQNN